MATRAQDTGSRHFFPAFSPLRKEHDMCKTTKKYLRTSVESSNAESLAYPLRGARQSLFSSSDGVSRGLQGPPSLRKYFFSSLFPLLLSEENTEKDIRTPSVQ